MTRPTIRLVRSFDFKLPTFSLVCGYNAEHSGDLGVATKEPRKGRPAAAGRVLMRIVRCRLPGTLLWHPNLNAYSRYVAPTQSMAPGTRTPNGRKLTNECAGLPRDLNTERAAKTAARPAAVFCPITTAKPRPNTKPKTAGARHLTLAACAPTEWSRRRNVVGVAVPALVMCQSPRKTYAFQLSLSS